MADFILRISDLAETSEKPAYGDSSVRLSLGPKKECTIYGKEGTYRIVQNGDDIVISLGYVASLDGATSLETLTRLLETFEESQIGDLKKKLIGEYVILVKKGDKVCLFSDFTGVRNIFYSRGGKSVSSSFSRLEDKLQTIGSDLDLYKFVEYIAMKKVLYPSWLGTSTYHRRIGWLLPYEYLVCDSKDDGFRTGSVVYSIDNRKISDVSSLSNELISILTKIVARAEFKQSTVAASLTGGNDSRLVAAVALAEYQNVRFRTAAYSKSQTTLMDLKVARRVAKAQRIPLDIFWFQEGRDEERFRNVTEGFSPVFNQSIAPLLDAAGSYAIGFGGAFGTESFMDLPWNSIEDFIDSQISRSRQTLKMGDDFWRTFRESLYSDFSRIKRHFLLSAADERDYVRIFGIIFTARYGSFIISAFNGTGYQIDPYGSYCVLELALRVPQSLWGNHRNLRGKSLVQKAAMAGINPHMGRPLTYSHFRPMLPLTARTFPKYLLGFGLQIGDTLALRHALGKSDPKRTGMPGGYYLSDGWETYFIDRTSAKYGRDFKENLEK